MDDEYLIRLIDLPTSVKALVVYDEDGFANIYVNAHLSVEEQRRAIRHELAHVRNGDAFSAADISAVEEAASRAALDH